MKNKQVFSASSVTEILNLSASAEVAGAIEFAVERGIVTTDSDLAIDASWWRNEDGYLFATPAMEIIPESRRVQLTWEEGLGYSASA